MEVGQILEHLQAASRLDIPAQRIAAKDLGHFEIEEMWSMKCLARHEKAFGNPGAVRRSEQDLEDHESVFRTGRSDRTPPLPTE
jgi:hypothetical protein